MKQGQFPTVFNLTDLNGQNGFKIDADSGCSIGSACWMGYAVSQAGDINGDGYADFMVGAPYADRTYVVFGQAEVGSSGLISLATLNGANGFKIYGEALNDFSGSAVSAVGDINGDGHDDLIIGAYRHNQQIGRSYVVFGGPGVGNTGIVNLANLNGLHGFKLDGEVSIMDESGFSVSGAGDVNGDGYADVMIGSPNHNNFHGRIYIVFGGHGMMGSGGLFNLTNLNGANGFKIDGELAWAGMSGWSVSAAGDINGDGRSDLIVGAPQADAVERGRSYVLFGDSNIGRNTTILLSSLNGTNGFILVGENYGYSGVYVNSVGDINNDGFMDLLIGAPDNEIPFYPNNLFKNGGRSYVLFGGPKIGSNGLIALSSLNGTNGFKLVGENIGDSSGCSLGTAGDFNGDGHIDLLIGALGYYNSTGRSYVVFGGPGVGQEGIIQLSTLNGTNGFKLDGEAINDLSGFSVSAAGDINGDGLDDVIIGAYGYNGGPNFGVGRSYVVFGDVAPQLWVNQLTLRDGETIVFTPQNLNATDNGPVLFNITQLQHGRFQYVNSSGNAITNFTQPQISNRQVEFVHDGSGIAPSYWVQTINSGIALSPPPQPANITFTRRLILVKNSLLIHQGQTVQMTSTALNATDDFSASQINMTLSAVEHGQFVLAPGNQSIPQFSQQQLLDEQVFFIADGSANAPGYQVIVNDPDLALTPAAANITFYRKPVIQNNQLVIHQGENLQMTSGFLNITDDYPLDQVNITISAVQHGAFQFAPTNDSISQFTALQLLLGQIRFVQDGGASAPGYQLSVNDPYFVLPPNSANITFYRQPVFLNNRLSIHQGEIVRLNASGLVVLDDYPSDQVNITVSQIQDGQFELPGQNHSITTFTGQQLLSGQVFFIQDNSTGLPGYQLSIRDPYFSLPPSPANITFYRRPTLQLKSLLMHQGQSLLMTPALLNLTDDAAPDQIIFIVDSVQHGQFIFTPGNLSVTTFTEQQLLDSQIDFVQDGSVLSPGYQIGMSDGYFSLPAQAANITFYRRPVWVNHSLTIHQGESLVINPAFLSVSDDYPSGQVNFTVVNPQHGQWKLSPDNQSVSEFTQQQLLAGQVILTQDDSSQAPAFAVVVNDPYFTLSPVVPNITFYHRPVLINNQLAIVEQGATLLSENSLNVADDYPPDQVWFQINQVQHGQFELLPSNVSITRFTQQQVSAGQIQLRQDGSELSPQYNVSVSDPFFAIGPFPGQVIFTPIYDDIPVFLNNHLTTLQGRTSVLSATDLSALDENPQVDQNTLLFTVTQVQHGFFNQIQNPEIPVTQFTQEQVGSREIAFTQDGTGFSPAYDVLVSDGVLSSQAQTANITFYAAPMIIVNQLAIAPGETVVFSRANLRAIPNAYTTEAELVFTASDIEHGYFSMIELPNVSVIQFTQDAVTNSEVEFTQDGSDQIPAYTLMVTDNNGLTAGPSIARVTLNTPSAINSNSTSNTVRNAIIGAVISGVVGFGFFTCQFWVKRKAESYLERMLEEKDGVGKEQAEYYKNVLRPMAKKILNRIKLTGFLNYISENTLKDALSAVTILVHELEKQGVEVDLSKLRPLERNRLLDTVARKARQILVPEVSCCSTARFARLFCPEVTPMQIEENAVAIAQAVKVALDSSALVASPLKEEIREMDSTPSLELQSAPVEEIKQLGEKSTPISGKNDTVLLVPDQSLSSSQRLDLPTAVTPTSKNRNSFIVNSRTQENPKGDSRNQQSQCILA